MISRRERRMVAISILQAVVRLRVGKYKLARFLNGSRSDSTKKLVGTPGYGSLFWYDQKTIRKFISQLERMELMKTHYVMSDNGPYPIMVLTDAGMKVLKDNMNVFVRIEPKKRMYQNRLFRYP